MTVMHLEDQRALLKQAGTAYPKATNLREPVRDRVNRAIRQAAFEAIPDFDPGTSVVEAVSSFRNTLNAKGILSLKFVDFLYPEGAAHGATQQSSVTLDLRDGRVYRFSDLFRPGADYQARLNQLIEAQIVANQIPLLRPFAGVGPDEDYYLTPDSLVLYYQPYVYTPGAFGVLEFTIPYAAIADLVDPQGPIGRLLYPAF